MVQRTVQSDKMNKCNNLLNKEFDFNMKFLEIN